MDLLTSLDPLALWLAVWPAIGVMLLRVADVTLNVFRMVFVVQERRLLSALAAAGESAMWLSAAGIVFSNLTPARAIGFVAGVAAGTALGVEVARRMRLGMATVRVYADATRCDEHGIPLGTGHLIADAIRVSGFPATVFRGHGMRGEVDMVLSTVRRRDAEKVVATAREVDGTALAAIDNAITPSAMGAVSTTGRV